MCVFGLNFWHKKSLRLDRMLAQFYFLDFAGNLKLRWRGRIIWGVIGYQQLFELGREVMRSVRDVKVSD